jgi:hypothetical protein
MIDMRAMIEARRYGEIRMAVASEITGDLSRVLAKFGLLSDASMLVEHDRETALGILTELLWKDMAYEGECMPHERAESIAQSFFDQYSEATSRYYSNGNWTLRESWNPLTEATFDAGIIITGADKKYFCIWFEDED